MENLRTFLKKKNIYVLQNIDYKIYDKLDILLNHAITQKDNSLYAGVIKTYETDEATNVICGGEILLAVTLILRYLKLENVDTNIVSRYITSINFASEVINEGLSTYNNKQGMPVDAIMLLKSWLPSSSVMERVLMFLLERYIIDVETEEDCARINSLTPRHISIEPQLDNFEHIHTGNRKALQEVIKYMLYLPFVKVVGNNDELIFSHGQTVIATYHYDYGRGEHWKDSLDYDFWHPFDKRWRNEMSLGIDDRINPTTIIDKIIGSYIGNVLRNNLDNENDIEMIIGRLSARYMLIFSLPEKKVSISATEICDKEEYIVLSCAVLRLLRPYEIVSNELFTVRYDLSLIVL